jgi:hypothetical protein
LLVVVLLETVGRIAPPRNFGRKAKSSRAALAGRGRRLHRNGGGLDAKLRIGRCRSARAHARAMAAMTTPDLAARYRAQGKAVAPGSRSRFDGGTEAVVQAQFWIVPES